MIEVIDNAGFGDGLLVIVLRFGLKPRRIVDDVVQFEFPSGTYMDIGQQRFVRPVFIGADAKGSGLAAQQGYLGRGQFAFVILLPAKEMEDDAGHHAID